MSNPTVAKQAARQSAAAAPIRLESWQSYLRFAGRAPRTLAELASAKADIDYKRRVSEIAAMATKLDALQHFIAPLEERGIRLLGRDFSTYDGGKTIRIPTAFCTRTDDKLHEALIALGFKEVERKDWPYHTEVKLKHGRALCVAIDVTRTAAPIKAEATA